MIIDIHPDEDDFDADAGSLEAKSLTYARKYQQIGKVPLTRRKRKRKSLEDNIPQILAVSTALSCHKNTFSSVFHFR